MRTLSAIYFIISSYLICVYTYGRLFNDDELYYGYSCYNNNDGNIYFINDVTSLRICRSYNDGDKFPIYKFVRCNLFDDILCSTDPLYVSDYSYYVFAILCINFIFSACVFIKLHIYNRRLSI